MVSLFRTLNTRSPEPAQPAIFQRSIPKPYDTLNPNTSINLTQLLTLAVRAAEAASVEVLAVYNAGSMHTETKDDNSPLTFADKKAHAKISAMLTETSLPILSEEGKTIPYCERKHWNYFWMVDPLDGTKEFIRRNGEFTVNIALIHKNKPVLGVVAVPASREVFYAAENLGVWLKRNDHVSSLSKVCPVNLKQPGLRVVASRSHINEATQAFIHQLIDPVIISKGSSLKFMLLVEGKADVYPRYAPTMEWDTAAAHAIINEAGLRVIDSPNGQDLVYNKENLLNPYFIVR